MKKNPKFGTADDLRKCLNLTSDEVFSPLSLMGGHSENNRKGEFLGKFLYMVKYSQISECTWVSKGLVKLPILLRACAPISELPSNKSLWFQGINVKMEG